MHAAGQYSISRGWLASAFAARRSLAPPTGGRVAAAASGRQCQASSLDGGQLWKVWTRWWCGGSASFIFSPALVGVVAGCAKQEAAAWSRRCSRLPCHPRWQLAVFHLLLVAGATLGDQIRAAAVVVGVMAMAVARSGVASALGVVVVGILGGG
jgi:hypothetical protein